jgi:hypothetical protein
MDWRIDGTEEIAKAQRALFFSVLSFIRGYNDRHLFRTDIRFLRGQINCTLLLSNNGHIV